MALHVTIIIWQIYMVVMVELNLREKVWKKQNRNRTAFN